MSIAHLHDDVIWLQLPECISLQLCYADLCHAQAILHKRRKNTEYSSLPQSILVVVIKWCASGQARLAAEQGLATRIRSFTVSLRIFGEIKWGTGNSPQTCWLPWSKQLPSGYAFWQREESTQGYPVSLPELWLENKNNDGHVIRFSDDNKSPWCFARVVRPDHMNRARNTDHAARTCERLERLPFAWNF